MSDDLPPQVKKTSSKGQDIQEGRVTYCRVRGMRIYMETYGDLENREDRHVLLLHTAGTDAREWLDVSLGLTQAGFRTVAVDLPGHGRSDVPEAGPVDSIETFSDVIAESMAHIGFHRYSIIGCSVGGCIAIDMAIRHAHSVEGAVAMSAGDYHPTVPRGGLMMAQSDSGSIGWAGRSARMAVASAGSGASKSSLARIADLHRRSDPIVAAAALIAWNGHDVRKVLNRCPTPISVILGRDDFFIPDEVPQRMESYRCVRNVAYLTGIGHYPMLEVKRPVAMIRSELERLAEV